MPNLKTDRRSQRTQRIIHEALMALIQEKRYDAITVQDIIDRADVGRSTFYAHYQDKEDLMASLLTHMMDVLSQMPGQASATGLERLLPTRDLFEHVQQNQHLFKGMLRGRGLEMFFEKGQDYWSQKIAAELQAILPDGKSPAVPVPVTAHFVAGSLVTILRWWLDNKMPYSPNEMDQIVKRLVMPGIQSSL
jgi:AcrR family transcriptional regulator